MQLDERIALGVNAEVWRGRHTTSGVPLAVKVVDARWDTVGGLDREVGILASLDCAHVVGICDHGVCDERVWFAMAYASGGTLWGRTAQSWEHVRRILTQVLRGLAHAHARGVLHLDLKPSNVLFAEGDRVVLSDFEIGLDLGERSGQIVGSPGYMAPERFRADGDLGPWTDLYAVGCVAWELCCGVRPFPERDWALLAHAHSHRKLPPLHPRFPLPDGVDRWLRALLSKTIAGRTRCAADALVGLGQLGGELPAAELPSEPVQASLALRPLRTVRLVGRRAERSVLERALAQVTRDKAARVVVIRGGAGVGKSRLARWFSESADEAGAAVALGARFGVIPAAGDGLEGLVRRLLRCGSLTGDALREHVSGVVAQRWPGDAGLEMAALELVGCDAGDGPGLYESFERLVRRQDRPVVLWLDDAQWGPDALGLAKHALELSGLSLLIVLVVQDEALADQPVISRQLEDLGPAVEVLSLAPLPPAVQGDLVHAILPLQADLAARVQHHTAGNPLFADQLVRDWIDRGVLADSGSGYRLIDEQPLPESLAALWRRRIDDLIDGDASAGVALELAATLGLAVDREEWLAVCERAGVAVPDGLVGALVARRMAVVAPRDRGRWAFVHGKLTEALAVRAGPGQVGHHRLCAEMLLVRGRKCAARAGMHLAAGGLWDASVQPLLDGLRDAIETAELPVAMDRVERLERSFDRAHIADSDPRWGQLWALRSTLAQAGGENAVAAAFIDRASASAQRHGWRAPEIDLIVAGQRMLRGDIDGAKRAFEAVRSATSPMEGLHHRASIGLAMGEIRSGNLTRGAEALREVLTEPSAAADGNMAMRCWFGIANVSVQLGELGAAELAVQQAGEAARLARSRRGLAECETYRGEICRRRGELVAAEGHYRRAWRDLDVLDREEAVVARTNLGAALLQQGRVAEARGHYVAVLSEVSSRSAFLVVACHAGLLGCSAGGEAWDRHLHQVRELVAASGYVEHDIVELVQLASHLAAQQGRSDRAAAAEGLAQDLRARLD